MSEDNDVVNEGETGSESTVTLESLAAKVEQLTNDNTSLLNKNTQLLGETKAAKTAKRELETEADRLANAKAQEDGNWEQLYTSSEQKVGQLTEQFNALTGTISKEKVENAALKLAGELAEGTNVSLLGRFVQERLKHTEEGLKVVDKLGNLTVATIDDLKKEISEDAMFASLRTGNKSSGGGATGNQNTSGGAAKEIDRPTFDSMDQVARTKFFKGGGKVI